MVVHSKGPWISQVGPQRVFSKLERRTGKSAGQSLKLPICAISREVQQQDNKEDDQVGFFAVDLTKALKQMRGQKPYENLVKLIDRFYAAASVRVDLRSARSSLDTLLDIAIHGSPDERASLGNSLMTTIVILYARATDTQNRTRYKVGCTKPFNAEQRAKHEAIMDLRNQAIAHIGSPTKFYDAWIDERVVLEINEEKGIWIDLVWERANFRQKLMADLLELLDLAIPYVDRLCDERRQELAAELTALPLEVLQGILLSNRYDVHAYHDGSPKPGPNVDLGEMYRSPGDGTWHFTRLNRQ